MPGQRSQGAVGRECDLVVLDAGDMLHDAFAVRGPGIDAEGEMCSRPVTAIRNGDWTASLYNRALSATEVKQLYNAGRRSAHQSRLNRLAVGH